MAQHDRCLIWHNLVVLTEGHRLGVCPPSGTSPMSGTQRKDLEILSWFLNQFWIFIRRTDAKAEAPILWLPDVKNWLLRKDPDAGKDWRWEEKGTTEDEIVGWHHQLNGHEFEQALGVGDGQGSLACCSPWSRKELDTTEWLNWTYLGSNMLLPRKDPHHFCSLSIGQVKSCTYV